MKKFSDNILPAAVPGPDSMDVNPLTLSFPKSLEKLFLDNYFDSSITLVRFSLVVGIVIYGFFGILDALLIPSMKETLWIIRFGIVCPFLLAVIAFSFSSFFKKYFQLAVSSAMVVSGLGIIAMIAIIPPPVNYTYYAGLILVFLWGYTFTRVRFAWATAAGWSLVAFYEIVAIFVAKTPDEVLISNNFFFISANLACMFSCYYIEYYCRRDFYLAYLLKNEQEKITEANRTLEKIIHERTSELKETNVNLRQEIAERRRAEENKTELENQLYQSKKLEAVGTLAGGIAHDFNNLLMGIQGYTSLLLMESENSHKQREKLRNIEQYVIRGSELTRQLLGFARGGKYEAVATNINKLIENSSNLFGRTKKEITISVSLDSDAWTVEVDQGQIEQVLLNLYVNAWQAMPGGGHISIETKNILLDDDEAMSLSLEPGKYVKISVTDTGTGMDERTKERIFEPFFTTKEMGRGTGLGLASAYGIIKSHGGVIDVQSMIGRGTTFIIYLPGSKKEPVKRRKTSEDIYWGSETILIVDDEEMVLKVGAETLRALGYVAFSAQSGKEAIFILEENRDEIDLVILDMIMPDMNGSHAFDLMRRIKPDLKVLLASGYSITDEARQILERGCNGFIQKPYDLKTLSLKLREIIDPLSLKS